MKDYEKELELLRYRFWTEVFFRGITIPGHTTPDMLADRALKAFDARFPDISIESRNCNNCRFFSRMPNDGCYRDTGNVLFISDPGSHVCRDFVLKEKR